MVTIEVATVVLADAAKAAVERACSESLLRADSVEKQRVAGAESIA